MSIHTKKERKGSVNEAPTISVPQETCSLLLRTHTARLSGCIDLSDANVTELVLLKALQFVYVRAGIMARLNLLCFLH